LLALLSFGKNRPPTTILWKRWNFFQHYLISQILSFPTPPLEVHHLSMFMSKIEQICKHVYKTPYNNQGCLVFGVKFWTLLAFILKITSICIDCSKVLWKFFKWLWNSHFFLNYLVTHFVMQFKELILAN
jgi:hypothetical protein